MVAVKSVWRCLKPFHRKETTDQEEKRSQPETGGVCDSSHPRLDAVPVCLFQPEYGSQRSDVEFLDCHGVNDCWDIYAESKA